MNKMCKKKSSHNLLFTFRRIDIIDHEMEHVIFLGVFDAHIYMVGSPCSRTKMDRHCSFALQTAQVIGKPINGLA
jgi:hypothetical protein